MFVERLGVTSGFVESIFRFGLHKAGCGVPGLHNRPQPGRDGWLAVVPRNQHSGRRPE
jgi:hypothetical protein